METAPGIALAVESFGDAAERGPVLVFVHGIGAYAGPYRPFAAALAETGVRTYLPHLRGHGDSPPKRGRFGTAAATLDDVAALVKWAAERHPGREVVLGGESMGALIALAAVATRPDCRPGRLLLLSPALRLDIPRVCKAAFGPGVLLRALRGIPAHSSDRASGQRHPRFRTMCLEDQKMLQTVGVSYLLTIASIMSGWRWRYPPSVTQPVLVVQGAADPLMQPRGAQELAQTLPTGRLLLVPDAWHNLLWDELTAETTVAEIAGWLLDRS